ncbi:MAG: phage/plasmid primase, P4 family [Candidatus Caccovivens sp.]
MNKIKFLRNPEYPANDIGISKLFVDMFNDELVFCKDTGWYIWNGKFWERDAKDGGKVNELLKKMATYCLKEIASNPNLADGEATSLNKFYSKLLTRNYRDTILRDSMSVAPVNTSIFDKHKFLFNCQNGTYDFKRKIFRDFEKTDYLTDISNVVYDPNAQCPRFEQYLNEVMNNDPTKIDYLMKIAAYCLTGDTSRECFFVLYGDKTRNGKGTFVGTLTHLMGSYAKTLKAASITKKQFNTGGSNATPDIAKLKNTRLANVNEIEDNMMLDIALMKELTGGDTITARFLYQKSEFDFVPQFKILINTNVLPKMSEDSIFRSNRIHLICFDRHFEVNERDLGLKDKLKAETSGIFNMLIPYYEKLNKEGFVMPDSTKETIEQYQYNSNNVLLFTKEQLYEDKKCWETFSNVWNSYCEWCEKGGYSQMAKKTFKERLARCGATVDDRQARHYNSRGESVAARGWVQGFSLIKPISQQYELEEIVDDTLPF